MSPTVAAPPHATIASTGTTTFVLVLLLLLVGGAMVLLAVWLVRSTRADPTALAPLEVMGERRWQQSDAEARTSALAEVRPPGAPPPAPMIDYEPIDVVLPLTPLAEAAADDATEPSTEPADEAASTDEGGAAPDDDEGVDEMDETIETTVGAVPADDAPIEPADDAVDVGAGTEGSLADDLEAIAADGAEDTAAETVVDDDGDGFDPDDVLGDVPTADELVDDDASLDGVPLVDGALADVPTADELADDDASLDGVPLVDGALEGVPTAAELAADEATVVGPPPSRWSRLLARVRGDS